MGDDRVDPGAIDVELRIMGHACLRYGRVARTLCLGQYNGRAAPARQTLPGSRASSPALEPARTYERKRARRPRSRVPALSPRNAQRGPARAEVGHGSGAAKIEYRLAVDELGSAAIALLNGAGEIGEPAGHRGAFDRRSLRGGDAIDADIDERFITRKQNLVQPFAAPRAGEDDVDVDARLIAGEPDHLFGEIEYAGRLAHFEHIDRGARRPCPGRRGAMGGGRNDEIDRLAHRHEITHHLRMGDGDRAAALDLRLELRHDRADRTEHIAEADRNKPGTADACGALGI